MKNHLGASIKELLAVLFRGAFFDAVKIGLKYVPPVTLVWMRFALGVIILGITVFFRCQFFLPCPKDWIYFALLGFLGITFHQWLQSTGLVTSLATTTAWIVDSMLIFIAILGWLFLKEKKGWFQGIGIILVAFGVMTVVTRGNVISLSRGSLISPGDVLIFISAPNWAVFNIFFRRGLKTYPASLMMFIVMAFGWLFSSFLFFGRAGMGIDSKTPISWVVRPGSLGSILFRGGIHLLV